MTNTAVLAPTSTRSCDPRISRKKESVPHVFNCLPTLVRCSLRVFFSLHVQCVKEHVRGA